MPPQNIHTEHTQQRCWDPFDSWAVMTKKDQPFGFQHSSFLWHLQLFKAVSASCSKHEVIRCCIKWSDKSRGEISGSSFEGHVWLNLIIGFSKKLHWLLKHCLSPQQSQKKLRASGGHLALHRFPFPLLAVINRVQNKPLDYQFS